MKQLKGITEYYELQILQLTSSFAYKELMNEVKGNMILVGVEAVVTFSESETHPSTWQQLHYAHDAGNFTPVQFILFQFREGREPTTNEVITFMTTLNYYLISVTPMDTRPQ